MNFEINHALLRNGIELAYGIRRAVSGKNRYKIGRPSIICESAIKIPITTDLVSSFPASFGGSLVRSLTCAFSCARERRITSPLLPLCFGVAFSRTPLHLRIACRAHRRQPEDVYYRDPDYPPWDSSRKDGPSRAAR